jgi:hypothetical protein
MIRRASKKVIRCMTKPPILAQDNSRLSGTHSYGRYPFAINLFIRDSDYLSVTQSCLTTDFEPVSIRAAARILASIDIFMFSAAELKTFS